MTAVLITSRPSSAPARVTAATYRRRRTVAGGVFVGIITLFGAMLAGPLAGPGGVPASATGVQSAYERQTIVVRPGDTLWSIANVQRGDVSHAAYLDALVRLNGGASIEAGQRILLP